MTTDLIPVQAKLQKAPTLGNATIEFVDTQMFNVTPHTRSQMRQTLNRFVMYICRYGLSTKSVSNYGQFLIKEGDSINNASAEMSHIRRFLKWCWMMEYSEIRWYEYVPSIKKTPPPDPKIIRQEEYESLRKMCLNPDQDYLLVCGFTTGFRLGDCCKLRWDQIDQKEQIISPVLSKTAHSTGSSARIPYMSGGDMHKKLIELWETRDGNGYVCPNLAASYVCNNAAIAQGMRRVFNRAGLFDKSFKHFRCTFESRLANSGMNIALAAKITGRSDTRSILKYVIPDMDAARDGVAKALELHTTHKAFA